MRFLAPTMATYGFCAKDADPVEACELSTLSARQASEFFQVTPLYLSSQLSGRILADPIAPSFSFSAIK